ALGRGAEGMAIRVMNVDSRAIVHGRVAGPGLVEVGK
ncbi:MAG: flagella basal body P-ring formation protein FlgA, partial [Pseudomonadota bacterium]